METKDNALGATDKGKSYVKPNHCRWFRIREKNERKRVKEELCVSRRHPVAGWVNKFPVLKLNTEKLGVLIGSGLLEQ